MKFIVFYLQSINSLEGPGMFFSSAAIIRRLPKYTATVALYLLARSKKSLGTNVLVTQFLSQVSVQ